MAKKPNNTPQNRTLARIARTESYAEKVRTMFAATVNRILELNKRLPVIEDGEMFSFDAQSEKLRAEVERALRQLHAVATTAIQQGIRLEWETANAECDKIVQSVFGKRSVENPEFGAWTKRNGAAMRAFIARSESGLNLSQRVWQTTRQLRDEMEIAITCAVGDGTSAATLARHVRQYLNDPDLMFRRFRYRDPETGEWKRKWKKRVIDPETGKVHFVDYDKDSYRDQWTGRGYYKSSAQNAMRVARTETNIAYRRADNARWQQMDFVIGQRVHLSRSHPRKDICDKLAGDYPKDFVFDGWHPQCFCYVTPILIDEDVYDELMDKDDWRAELQKYADAHQVTDYPDNFKSWVSDNAENIAAARERGTEPYFIRNNAAAIDNILNPDVPTPAAQPTPAKRSIQEIAAERHAARTPEQIEQIEKAWRNRVIANLSNEAVDIGVYDEMYNGYINDMRTARYNGDTDAFDSIYSKARSAIVDFRNKIAGAFVPYTPNPAMRTSYAGLDEVRTSIVTIGKNNSWFPTGRMSSLEDTCTGANGSSNRHTGTVKLTSERAKLVTSAMAKIGRGESWKMTKKEADAMATMWHEMTHQMHIGTESAGGRLSKTRSYMELANEFVARHTLPDFYRSMGCKYTPYPSFIETRQSTGYNDMVCAFQNVIATSKLDISKVLSSIRTGLINSDYSKQKTVLIDGLISGGMKGKRSDIAKIVEMCEAEESSETITQFMKSCGII